jgi:hypothetical protein
MRFKFWQKEKREDVKPVKSTVQDTTMKILSICNTWDEYNRKKILDDVAHMAFDVPHHIHKSPTRKQVTA